MKSKRQIRREIDIARACMTWGLDNAVEDFAAATSKMDAKGVAWFRETFDKFLERHGSRPRKGEPFDPIPVEEVREHVVAHREFIMDAYASPDDISEYVKECQAATAQQSLAEATQEKTADAGEESTPPAPTKAKRRPGGLRKAVTA